MRHARTKSFLTSGALVLAIVGLGADTLYLRDGRRVEGQVVSMRDGTIEFLEARGFIGSRRVTFDRADVRRIEFDERSDSRREGFDNDRRDDRSGSVGDRRPSGLREREIVVSADVPWNDTNIDVRSGQAIYFSATGRVQWGPGRRDGPAGEPNSPNNPNRPIPRRPAAALIGRIGDTSTDYFFIGDGQEVFRMRSGGRLFLGVNDDYLNDNSSNFRVTVYY